ncbi:MAG: type II toxin-antitoxin system ParD family antitoxin [Desulfurococcales archaeon]|nr:type II toxin-antitoxin system ParD family antitoxin [Desulfurococcales archaeon]
MRLVTVKMPEIYVKGIEELVAAGRYSSRSEVIRIAVRELLKRELWGTAEYTGIPVPVEPQAKAYLRGVGVGAGASIESTVDGLEI